MDLLNQGEVKLSETDEKARRAVKAFRALQPTLTAYAQILTRRKDVRVEMAAEDNGSTDGKRIFFRPPIGLGDNSPHDRRLCDQRDEYKQLLCPACKIREEVLVTVYHEIAHIACETFAPPTEDDIRQMIERAVADHGSKYGEAIQQRLHATPENVKASFLGLARLISPFMPVLVNAMEDARVNNEQFKARRGTKIMFDADTYETFRRGVEQVGPDGKIKRVMWSDYQPNQQMLVGVFCKASGYDYGTFFSEEVVRALDDPELTRLVRQIDTARNAAAVYHLAFPVLARLRQLGYCKAPTDPPTEEAKEDERADIPPTEPEESKSEPDQDSNAAASPDAPDASGDGDDSPLESDSDSGDGSEQDQPSDSDGPDVQEEDEAGGGAEGEDSPDGGDADGDSEGDGGAPQDGSADHSEDVPKGGDSSEDLQAGESKSEASDDDDSGGDGHDSGSAGEGSPSEPAEEGAIDEEASGEGAGADGLEDAGPEREGGEPEDQGTDDEARPDAAHTSDAEAKGQDGSDSASKERGEGDSSSPFDIGGAEREDGDVDRSAGEADDKAPVEDRAGSPAPEPIDTGADEGQGGTQVEENEANDEKEMGSAEDAELKLMEWMGHGEKPKSVQESEQEQDAVERAVVQGIYFETPSREIFGVREHKYGDPKIVDGYNMSGAWDDRRFKADYHGAIGRTGDFEPEEKIIGPALLKARVAFSDNQRGKEHRHLKSGKVNGRVLGRRAALGDERLFKRRTMPGKKNYFVLISMDVSGSTAGRNLVLEKKAITAQAELLHRMGIKFAIYAHSGTFHSPKGRKYGFDLDVYLVKEPHEPWSKETKQRLHDIGPDSSNLDGHALEYMRHVLDRVDATDKVILYYSDGKMPAENYEEELTVLQREIRVCAKRDYTLLGVGIRTDSPARHGLDTVQVDSDADVVKVISHLQKRLVAS